MIPSLPADLITAIVFDVIGTLVDEDGAWASAAERVAAEAGLAMPADLRHRWGEALDDRMNAVISGNSPWRPHRRLASEALSDAIMSLGATPAPTTLAMASNLDREYRAWPDVSDATAALRRSRLVAGVSNGDLHSLARLANANTINWDVVLSTGAAQTFKPAPAAYQYAIDTLDVDPGRTLFVAAHPWDLRAAAGFGFRTAYIARPGAERPAESDHFDLAVDDLRALLEQLGIRGCGCQGS